KAVHKHFDEFREFLIIAASPALRFPGKPGHPLRNVCLEPDTLLFAIVADIHACGCLLLDHLRYCAVHRPGKLVFVHGTSLFPLDQKIGKFIVARQAADMSYKDPFPAGYRHHSLSCTIKMKSDIAWNKFMRTHLLLLAASFGFAIALLGQTQSPGTLSGQVT